MRIITRLLSIILYAGLALPLFPLLTGCGSGNRTAVSSLKPSVARGTGQAQVTVKWPEPAATRLIPVASKSIKITLKDGASVVAELVLERPNTVASFDNLPITTLTIIATAYPQSGGRGTAQATGTAVFPVQEEGITEIKLTMDSTIQRLEVAPKSVSVGVAYTTLLTATTYDSENRIVLTGPLQYTSAKRKIATIDANGVVKGQQVGTTTITVTDPESGRSAQVPVTVTRTAAYVVSWIALPRPYDLIFADIVDINDNGECVGYSSPGGNDPETRPWIWKPYADDVGGQFLEMGLYPNYTQVYPTGINTAGQVCGDIRRSNNQESKAFLWENGQYRILPTLGGPNASAYGINENGIIVGSAMDATQTSHPCIWKNGQCIEILVEGRHIVGSLLDINDQDVAVGWESPDKPILWRNGIGSYLPFHPNYPKAQAWAINNQNQIAGWLIDSDTPDAFRNEGGVWTGGQVLGVGSLSGKIGAIARGINDQGYVIGNTENSPEGYRWRNGKIENLNDLIPPIQQEFYPDTIQIPSAINNLGQIVGSGIRGPFVLTPQGNAP